MNGSFLNSEAMMTPYTFLSALPALLALAGFVLYQLVGANRSGDEVTRRIVSKLRKSVPARINKDQRLTSQQVERILLADHDLQKVVGDQDFQLLKQALRQQFVISLTVYSLAIVFCSLSVFLFVHQAQAKKELRVEHFSFKSLNPSANGLPVDIDPIEISWQSFGEPEDTKVCLENVQTQSRTDFVTVAAAEHSILFEPNTYRSILTNRKRGQTNQLRMILQSRRSSFVSNVIDLPVGITILTVVNSSAQLTLAAMIDNTRIPNYDFEAKIAIPPRTPSGRFVSVGPNIPYRFKPEKIPNSKQLDWVRAKGVYLGPDDSRLVRFQFLIDSSLNP